MKVARIFISLWCGLDDNLGCIMKKLFFSFLSVLVVTLITLPVHAETYSFSHTMNIGYATTYDQEDIPESPHQLNVMTGYIQGYNGTNYRTVHLVGRVRFDLQEIRRVEFDTFPLSGGSVVPMNKYEGPIPDGATMDLYRHYTAPFFVTDGIAGFHVEIYGDGEEVPIPDPPPLED